MESRNVLRTCLLRSLQEAGNHPQYRHYIHFSYAIVGGKIEAVGRNQSAAPDVHFGYNRRGMVTPKIHAELDAYRKLRKKFSINRIDWSLVNVRVNRSGEFKMSKPCVVCQEWLAAVGCESITYTTERGWNAL